MVRKVFRKMSGAQIISSMTVTVCLFIDSIVIGRLLGVDAMSSYGLANPVIIIFSALGIMASCGVQVLTGEAMGRGDTKGCSRIFSTSVVMSLLLALVWIVLIFTAAKPLCMLLAAGGESQNAQVLTMTSDYLKGYIIGSPFFFLSQIMVPYLQSMGKQRLTLISVITMTVVDIVFDLLSVYVFHAGMFGIGMASSFSYLAMLLVGIGFFMKKDCLFKFDIKAADAKTAGAMAHAGSPIVVNQAGFMIRVYVINQLLLATSGTTAVAVFSAVSTMGNIIFSIGLGAGSITLMLASIFHSEEDRTSLYELVRVMIPYTFEQIIGAVILVEIFASRLITLFLGNDPAVLSIGPTAVRLYFISLIAAVLTTVMKNYYQGTGRMSFTNVISICDNVALLLPFTWLFSTLMGLTGVWVGIIVGQFASLFMIFIVSWVRYGRISFSPEAISMLDKDFGADPEDVFVMSVTDMDSAISASEKIDEFCTVKGLGKRLATLVSLCVEEIVVNIIDHGFTKDDHNHHADVRLVVHEDKCIIRVRDNCIGFDPTKYLELHQSSNPADHIGIKMVVKMVDEINYINSLGLNNLYMSLNKNRG